MNKFINNVKKYYKYALRMAKAELKSEVAGSHLNWLWWVIEPICFMFVYTFVFTVIFKAVEEYFAAYVFFGLTLWEFFNRMITGSISLIESNRNTLSKVYIPKYILLLSKSFTYLFKLLISFLIAFILMLVLKVPLGMHLLYFFLIFPIYYLFTFGLSCIIMHFAVFVEDLKNLTKIALRLLFYMSGVFYSIGQRLNGQIENIMLNFNPVAFFMSEIRNTMIYSLNPNFVNLSIWCIISVVLCMIGINLIHKYENSYAKVI